MIDKWIAALRYRRYKLLHDIPMKIAWILPKTVVMWCYVRVGAHATTGKYSDTVVPDLSMMDALQRWDDQ